MPVDNRLAMKGIGEPRQGLVDQGHYHQNLVTEHRAGLQESGWSEENHTQFVAGIATLEGAVEDQSAQRSLAKNAAKAEVAARGVCKRFLRALRNALPMALRAAATAGNPGVTRDNFNAGHTLGNNTGRISAHLNKIRPFVIALDEPLRRYFKGQTPSEELDRCKAELDNVNAIQEAALADLPAQTAAVYEAKGRVLEAIEDINRIARIAFDGDALTIAKFNKDLLLRARKERKAANPLTPPS